VTRVAVALGSNLGNREGTLRDALDALAPLVRRIRVSSFYQTEPVGVTGEQPLFLNAAATGETALDPGDLLAALMTIEQRFGRERPYEGAPRTLDLDLILYGHRIVNEPNLIVPHPRFRERAFVLRPLSEIAADWIDPVSGLTVAQLLDALTG
jgi:2-amino-4-hydroxy-6-hydroxymethyldihydropteridine diphosphokinase